MEISGERRVSGMSNGQKNASNTLWEAPFQRIIHEIRVLASSFLALFHLTMRSRNYEKIIHISISIVQLPVAMRSRIEVVDLQQLNKVQNVETLSQPFSFWLSNANLRAFLKCGAAVRNAILAGALVAKLHGAREM